MTATELTMSLLAREVPVALLVDLALVPRLAPGEVLDETSTTGRVPCVA